MTNVRIASAWLGAKESNHESIVPLSTLPDWLSNALYGKGRTAIIIESHHGSRLTRYELTEAEPTEPAAPVRSPLLDTMNL